MTSISVIIPQYGQQNLTTRLIGQLRQFEPSETELIVVDDGSPEGTVSDKLSDEKIRFIQQTHRGVTATWNTGAKEATGNVLVFLNNDVNVTGPFLTPLIEPLFHSDPAMTGPQLRTERLLPITLSPKSPRTLLEGWVCCRGT